MTERSRWAIPRLARVAAAWVAAVVLGANVLMAQGTTGKIEGTVRDQSGAPVNGAQVFIQGTAFAAVSNERGYYFINNVPAGVLVARAQYIGFRPAVETILKVSEGRPNVIDHIKNGDIQLVINVSLGRRSSRKDAYHIRRGALVYNVLYTTTISGARALTEAIDALQREPWDVTPLQAYHDNYGVQGGKFRIGRG